MEEIFYPGTQKKKIAMNSLPGGLWIFPEPRKLPPISPLLCGLSPTETSIQAIKLWKEKGSPLEGSEITVVVSSVTDNLERVFLGLMYTPRGVTNSMTQIQELYNELHSGINDVCYQVGVHNLGEITLAERFSDV